ncbi:MAG: ABC transporter ATP-binding protein [Spirochaetales bacterium]|nr:ABC transporter ATP-binding protein [Spirochaetales bacterium]
MPIVGTGHLELTAVNAGYLERSGFFARRQREFPVCHDIHLTMERGKTLGLVGESGSGKTTLGRAILGLASVFSGTIRYHPPEGPAIELQNLNQARWRPLRKKLQIIFQDPFSTLNPRLSIESILSEGMRVHFPDQSQPERQEKMRSTLDLVGLSADVLSRYPHEFSGGQRQRISIARALILDPEFIVADECVSALDVSIQAQIINLLLDLQDRLGLTYLFISHDLAVVKHLSHEIAVMQEGRIVEKGSVEKITATPEHPYTRELLEANLAPAI